MGSSGDDVILASMGCFGIIRFYLQQGGQYKPLNLCFTIRPNTIMFIFARETLKKQGLKYL